MTVSAAQIGVIRLVDSPPPLAPEIDLVDVRLRTTVNVDNLGAILAVCGWLEESGITPAAGLRPPTMRTLLEAMVKAYEIQGRFQNMNSFNGLGIDHTCLVRLASTAVVSWLIGLDEEQTLAAISHVFMDGCALRVFRAGSNTIPRKGWAAGDACMRAVQLAFITRAGQPGAPSVLTMPRWGFYDAVWRGKSFQFPPEPYDTFVMETVAFKLAPVEGHTLLAAYAMLEQARRIRARGLDPFQDVVEIRVRTCRVTIVITDKPGDLHNPADRDHSLQVSLPPSPRIPVLSQRYLLMACSQGPLSAVHTLSYTPQG